MDETMDESIDESMGETLGETMEEFMEDEEINKDIPLPPPATRLPRRVYTSKAPSRWRSRLEKAAKRPPSYISLGEEALRIDAEDENLQSGGIYRGSLDEKDRQEKNLERVVRVLHHLEPASVQAMISGDFNALRQSRLPPQLTEQLNETMGAPGDKDHKKFPSKAKRQPGKEYHLRAPVIYQHWHVNAQGLPPT